MTKIAKKWWGVNDTTRGFKEKIRWAGSFVCVLLFSGGVSGVMAGYH